jgi:hypothetical protein
MSRILIPKPIGQQGDAIGMDFNEVRAEDSETVAFARTEAWIGREVGQFIAEKLPNRHWKIHVDLPNQLLIIACDSVSNEKGWHIHMAGRNIHDLQAKALYAASEILERHDISRAKKFNPDKLETLDRDSFDNVITPDSKAEPIDGN